MRSKFFILFSIVLVLIVGAVFGVSQKAFAAGQQAGSLLRFTRTPTRTATKFSTSTTTPTTTPTVAPGTPTWTATPSFSDFYGSPTSGAAPLTVQFTARYGPVYNCTWTFGDGTSQTFGPIGANGYIVCPSVSHIYSTGGTYTVSLRVSTLSGINYTTTKANYIQVNASGISTPTLTRTPTKIPTVSGT